MTKEPLVRIGQETKWAPEPVWMRWRREPNPGRLANSLVTTLTELSRLLPTTLLANKTQLHAFKDVICCLYKLTTNQDSSEYRLGYGLDDPG